MKQFYRWLSTSMIIVMVLMVLPVQDAFGQSTSRTYSFSADGQLVQVQDAYTPVGIVTNEELMLPEDMVIYEELIYIVDSRARQVFVMEKDGTIVNSFGQEYFMTPTGIAIDHQGNIFVADGVAQRVFKFDPEGNLLLEIERPTNPLFGANTPFSPVKLHVDVRGNIYIVGEGSTNGLIQLNSEGEFLGYFGSNSVATSFIQTLRDIFLTDAMNARVFSNLPPAPTNLTMDSEGAVYTVTNSLANESTKKMNIAGENMLADIYSPENPIDIAVGPQNRFYVLTSNGVIDEFNRSGNLVFEFGSQDTTTQRLGIFIRPSAIDVDEAGLLYVLDAEGGVIQRFSPTAFAREIHAGLALYEDGRYVESADFWQNVLDLNPSFVLARHGVGEALFKEQDYEGAMEEFRLAFNFGGYSQSFWEIRNEWLNRYAALLLAIIAAIFLIRWVFRKYFKKEKKKIDVDGEVEVPSNYDFLNPDPQPNLKMNIKSIRYIITKPTDVFYEISIGRIGTLPFAFGIFGALLLMFVLYFYFTGFLFNPFYFDDVNVIFYLLLIIAVLVLFIAMNYLVSTITDGQGTIRDLVIGTAYSLSPFIIGVIPMVIMSNIFTYNEAFIYELFLSIMIVYSLGLLFIMIKEIHNFTFWETVKNIILTIFLSFIFLIVVYVIYLLLNQIYDFVVSVFREVSLRV